MKISKTAVVKVGLSVGLLTSIGILTACSNATSSNKLNYKVTPELGSDYVDFASKNAPMSSCWLPSQLLKWSASTDKNLAYNKSTVSLKKRISSDNLKASNDTQNKQTKIVALMAINSSTSGNLSRGNNTFGGNSISQRMPFDYWQYIDTMVYWGGSMGEGTVVPPSADVIDEAHLNGVPILGNVFIPDATQWSDSNNYEKPTGIDSAVGKLIDTMLARDSDGDYPFAKKLVEVAKTYGFDGWFFNAEGSKDLGGGKYGLTPTQAAEFKILIQQIHKLDPKLQIMWYDAMTDDGSYDNYWQGQLDSQNATYLTSDQNGNAANSMFIDFRWAKAKGNNLEKSADFSKKNNINPYSLFAGVELEQVDDHPVANLTGNWASLESGKNSTYTSIGLFRPDNTFTNASDFDQYQQLESQLWVNKAADPRQTFTAKDGEDTPGISHYVVEKSAIQGTDFQTNFSLGNGYNWFNKGQKISNLDWSNRSLAETLPTYRWSIDNQGSNQLTGSIDYANAYSGGNSIKFMANMDVGKSSTVNLFETGLKANKNTQFDVAVRSDAKVEISAVVTLSDGSVKTIKGNKEATDYWGIVKFDTKSLSGKTISKIALRFKSSKALSGNAINVGQLTFSDKENADTASLSNAKITSKAFEEEGTIAGIGLSWKVHNVRNVDHYEIYQEMNGKEEFLGASNIPSYFANALERTKKQTSSTFKVIPVNKEGDSGKTVNVSVTWPDNSLPKAAFTADDTVIPEGSQVKFINESNTPSVKFKWEIEGADQKTSTKKNPVITFSKAGNYSVKLTAINDKGKESSVTQKSFITVLSGKASFTNFALNRSVETDGETGAAESGSKAVDGKLDTKWCAVGTAKHHITIDLGAIQKINQVDIAHAEAGGESPSMNTKAYTIEVSTDNKTWKGVVNVTNNKASKTKDSFGQTDARYVRLTAIKPTQGSDSAVRWYEIQVFGLTHLTHE